MSTIQNQFRDGDVFGFRYVFEQAGDGVRTRAPYREAAHSILVVSGSVSIDAEGEASRTVLQGHACDFDGSQEHYITALEPNTMALNLMIFDQPESYKRVPEFPSSTA
jgi:hypothetical protein